MILPRERSLRNIGEIAIVSAKILTDFQNDHSDKNKNRIYGFAFDHAEKIYLGTQGWNATDGPVPYDVYKGKFIYRTSKIDFSNICADIKLSMGNSVSISSDEYDFGNLGHNYNFLVYKYVADINGGFSALYSGKISFQDISKYLIPSKNAGWFANYEQIKYLLS